MHVFFNIGNFHQIEIQQTKCKVKASRTTPIVDRVVKVILGVKTVNGWWREVCAAVSHHVKCEEHSVGTNNYVAQKSADCANLGFERFITVYQKMYTDTESIKIF